MVIRMTLEKSFPAMGTVHTITIFDAEGPGAASDARAYLMTLNRNWTCFRADSLISRRNYYGSVSGLMINMAEQGKLTEKEKKELMELAEKLAKENN